MMESFSATPTTAATIEANEEVLRQILCHLWQPLPEPNSGAVASEIRQGALATCMGVSTVSTPSISSVERSSSSASPKHVAVSAAEAMRWACGRLTLQTFNRIAGPILYRRVTTDDLSALLVGLVEDHRVTLPAATYTRKSPTKSDLLAYTRHLGLEYPCFDHGVDATYTDLFKEDDSGRQGLRSPFAHHRVDLWTYIGLHTAKTARRTAAVLWHRDTFLFDFAYGFTPLHIWASNCPDAWKPPYRKTDSMHDVSTCEQGPQPLCWTAVRDSLYAAPPSSLPLLTWGGPGAPDPTTPSVRPAGHAIAPREVSAHRHYLSFASSPLRLDSISICAYLSPCHLLWDNITYKDTQTPEEEMANSGQRRYLGWGRSHLYHALVRPTGVKDFCVHTNLGPYRIEPDFDPGERPHMPRVFAHTTDWLGMPTLRHASAIVYKHQRTYVRGRRTRDTIDDHCPPPVPTSLQGMADALRQRGVGLPTESRLAPHGSLRDYLIGSHQVDDWAASDIPCIMFQQLPDIVYEMYRRLHADELASGGKPDRIKLSLYASSPVLASEEYVKHHRVPAPATVAARAVCSAGNDGRALDRAEQEAILLGETRKEAWARQFRKIDADFQLGLLEDAPKCWVCGG